MAAHLHSQIRAALVTALTGLTTTGANVFGSRRHPFRDEQMPGLRVLLDSESAGIVTVHVHPILERALDIAVEIAVKGSDLDDTLDQSSLEVEQRLAAGLTVDGALLIPDYLGFDFDEEALGAPAGVKRLKFRLTYASAANAPDTIS